MTELEKLEEFVLYYKKVDVPGVHNMGERTAKITVKATSLLSAIGKGTHGVEGWMMVYASLKYAAFVEEMD